MTTQTGIEAERGADFVRAWQDVRADGNIQFAPIEQPPPPETPDWLQRVFEFIGMLLRPLAEALGAAWPVGRWVLLAAAIAVLLYMVWRLLPPMRRAGNAAVDEAEAAWAPDRSEAMALLADADRLAASGHFEEATHLLLKRSVGQIASARPDWLDPSSTAREIASLPGMSLPARSAFGVMAERVERSLFALRRLDADDWQAARSAYSEFALADLAQGGAA